MTVDLLNILEPILQVTELTCQFVVRGKVFEGSSRQAKFKLIINKGDTESIDTALKAVSTGEVSLVVPRERFESCLRLTWLPEPFTSRVL